MSDKNRVLVIGATGLQGGSVARHLLKTNDHTVRALTRNPDSDAAQALRQAGAEIAQGNLDDPVSLKKAMDGCDSVFGVTNFWEHFDKETTHGKNIVDAVAEKNIQHLVLSTLADPDQVSGGTIDVPHLKSKALVEQYAREKSIPVTFVHVAFYYENYVSYFPPKRHNGDDGPYVFGYPQGDTPLAAVAVEDIGGVVLGILKRRDGFLGRTVGVVGEDAPPHRHAEVLSRTLKVPVQYQHIPRDVFAGFGFPGAEDLANMFEMNRLHIPGRGEDLKLSRELYPGIQTFEQWTERHKDTLRAALS